jgi:hypothetical protein
MIFQRTYQWVLDRSPNTGKPKTQTRRLAKDGDIIITPSNHPLDHTARLSSPKSIFAVERNGRLLYEVGRTYAIQPGRGKHTLGRIRLRAIVREVAQEISEGDARAEGFASPAEFREVWIELYGRGELERLCYALVIERVMG